MKIVLFCWHIAGCWTSSHVYETLTILSKKSLKIPKASEAIKLKNDRQCNDQKKQDKKTNKCQQDTTQKINDWTTQTSPINWSELGCPGRVPFWIKGTLLLLCSLSHSHRRVIHYIHITYIEVPYLQEYQNNRIAYTFCTGMVKL